MLIPVASDIICSFLNASDPVSMSPNAAVRSVVTGTNLTILFITPSKLRPSSLTREVSSPPSSLDASVYALATAWNLSTRESTSHFVSNSARKSAIAVLVSGERTFPSSSVSAIILSNADDALLRSNKDVANAWKATRLASVIGPKLAIAVWIRPIRVSNSAIAAIAVEPKEPLKISPSPLTSIDWV